MSSTSMSPYLDAELAYRLERLSAGVAHPAVYHRRRLWPALSRGTRAVVHRPASHN